MSDHLLLVTLGPVQDFIAAARRTRDLWFGSHLLSELSRAAAKALADQGCELIFPALAPDDPPLSVTNKILAVVHSPGDAAELAKAARDAAQERLVVLANTASSKAGGLLADDVDAVWDEQLATALEFCAGWLPLADGGYHEARQELERAVAGRKMLREFRPWVNRREGAPKSSLDGARDSLLREREKRNPGTVRTYRIADNEQLDALGVLKRCGGDPEQFVPLRNVAVADWLRQAQEVAPRDLADVIRACGDVRGLLRVDERLRLPCVAPFRFDADVLFPDRWSALARELGLEAGLPTPVRVAVQTLVRAAGTPPGYVCCLHADGDRMGVAIDQLQTAAEHRQFSQRLSAFAPAAKELVESDEFRGALVYAGGDDVLAFLPVGTAVGCADALRLKFVEVLGTGGPTLSVGLAFGHALTGMGDLLDQARRAERLAKQDRNSLAVILQKRSGGEDAWTALWDQDPAGQLGQAVTVLDHGLPRGKVSEVRDWLHRCPATVPPSDDADWTAMMDLEVRRILSRAHGGGEHEVVFRPTIESANGYAAARMAVDNWVNLMRIAIHVSSCQTAVAEEVTA